MKASPLSRQIELLAGRARLDLAPAKPPSDDQQPSLGETLGLTIREAEVLTLLARGYTNREIADELVISVKTASVHVSHILQKLDAPNRGRSGRRRAPPRSSAARPPVGREAPGGRAGSTTRLSPITHRVLPTLRAPDPIGHVQCAPEEVGEVRVAGAFSADDVALEWNAIDAALLGKPDQA